MMKYSSGAIVGNRYLLVDNLTNVSSSDVQVWSAVDNKTGIRVQGNFYKDGRIEWIPDKSGRELMSSFNLFFDKIKLSSRLLISVLSALLFLIVGYLYQRELASLLSIDSKVSQSKRTYFEEHFNGEVGANELLVGPVNWRSSAIELDKLEDRSGEDQTAFFVNSVQSFNRLRQYAVSSAQVDSLYNLYIARGNKCITHYQQESKPELKVYALNWLNLAFVLRPSLILEEYINRLGGKAMEQLPVPVYAKREVVKNEEDKAVEKIERKQKSKTKMSELFLKDPEIQ